MLVLFGWMDALIIGKWMTPKYVDTNISTLDPRYNETTLSPPVITTMIDMFLASGSNKGPNGEIKYNYVFEG